LPPWFENLKKRQVRSPKIYVRDTGLLHALLSILTEDELAGNPKLGASWEGFVIEQLVATLGVRDAYFWGTHNGAELDLMLMMRGKRHGFECKYADAPGPTKSMRTALADLNLAHLWVIYPGKERYVLDKQITVVPASEIPLLAEELKTPHA
jgi:predicted AAA+ superfamily ATPase